ncbi:Hypothetical predicted protein, partial [Mytilus galloprovincialis]
PPKITMPSKTDCGPPKITSTPKCECNNGPPKNTETPKCDCGYDMLKQKRVADIFLMLIPLFSCYLITRHTINRLDKHGAWLQYLCLFVFIVYFVTSILIMILDMSS